MNNQELKKLKLARNGLLLILFISALMFLYVQMYHLHRQITPKPTTTRYRQTGIFPGAGTSLLPVSAPFSLSNN